jgi:uncharacterized protein YwgA
MLSEKTNIRPILLLSLLYEAKNKLITGKTRLQKLLFLLQEEQIKSQVFTFKAYKYGPYSEEVDNTIESLSFKDFIKVDNSAVSLSNRGKELIETKLESKYSTIIEKAKAITSNFGSLNDELLLLYVYTKYPQYTIKLEIKDEMQQVAEKYFKILQRKAKEFGFKEEDLVSDAKC